MSRFKTLTQLYSCGIAAALGVGATGQVAAQIEEVVVTAQKRAQGINDLGITVNAFAGETLRDLGILSAEDIATYTPGLSVNAAGATGVPVYTIRGVGFQDLTTSSSSTVGIYFDEVAIPYTVMSRGALFDIQRVEVLKGPQGDLYGRNTTAGQINYISNKPTDQFEAGILGSYGRFQELNVEGHVSGPLTEGVQGRFAFRTVQSGEGWQKSLTRPGDTLGEKDVMAVRGQLNFDLNQDASLLISASYGDDRSDNMAQTAYDGRDIGIEEFSVPYNGLDQYRLPTGSNFGETPPWYSTGDNRRADWTNEWTSPLNGETVSLRPERDNQRYGIYGKLEWNLDWATLTSITSYDEFERSETNDVDGTHLSIQENINITDLSVFSQELRLSGESNKMFWIAGLYYSEDEVDEFYNFFMQDALFGDGAAAWGLPLPFASNPIYRLHTKYKQETESAAAFGRVEYQLTDRVRLTLGARYTEEKRDWAGCTFDAGDGSLASFWNAQFGSTLQPGDCGTLNDIAGSPTNISSVAGTPRVNEAFQVFETDISTEKWMWRAGLDYAFSGDLLGYATISTGFKSGGFNGNNSNTTAQLQPYKPEELTAYELGLKSTLLDGNMQLNIAGFFYDYEDKQESERSITPVGAIGGLGNVPKSEITGLEFDLQWTPVSGLVIAAGASWLETEIKRWDAVVDGTFDFATGQVSEVITVDASGQELPQAPELSYNILATYEWSVGNGLVASISGDMNYTDDMPDPVRPQNSVESYTLYNARLGLGNAAGDWRALLWSRNLTDEYYYPAAFGGVNGGFARSVGMPRTYGVSLEYNF
ncbi:TonB-dependent receptor [Kineobactrum salinum]|uniref:TonB-dependent receptor n=1 Tax=Kineobactrum salinum TaxID=2708301 RepID=A0A6C0U3T6_9GAMM|nr:TonB-dependent receptor [Kineobactrum salinum]QIB66771.1 TonB-dependent receptor [Kineobactrum salinum]